MTRTIAIGLVVWFHWTISTFNRICFLVSFFGYGNVIIVSVCMVITSLKKERESLLDAIQNGLIITKLYHLNISL